MSVEEKTPYIMEWMQAEMKAMRQCGLTEFMLEEMLESHGLILREGFDSLCEVLSDAQIPFIVSTAGLADVVEGALRRWDLYYENMAIIGNRFAWDPKTKALVGNRGDFVHTLNKEVSMKKFFENKEDAKDDVEAIVRRPRKNVLLIGDSLGDTRMTLELPFVENVIKVGFLNDPKPESKLEAFLSSFDIVLVNDPTMEIPTMMLQMISGISPPPDSDSD